MAAALVFAEVLQKKHKKHRLYLPVILASILNGRVQSDDFLATQMLILDSKTVKELRDEMDEGNEVATIQVNKESSPSEVMETFNFMRKYYFKTIAVANDDKLVAVFNDEPYRKLPDTVSNLQRDRKWYRQHMNGVSYKAIYKLEKNVTEGAIIRAIKQYRDFLKGV
ncbi:MAG: hypothetical protein M1484_04030 [Patescibacteria group bacterium]|nr:hypothetical protein [Patescibacteria group bacterium]